jgi:hypothetical protein
VKAPFDSLWHTGIENTRIFIAPSISKPHNATHTDMFEVFFDFEGATFHTLTGFLNTPFLNHKAFSY